MSSAGLLRKQAEKCRFLADRTADPKVAATLREIARDYEAEADRVEAAAPESPEIKAT